MITPANSSKNHDYRAIFLSPHLDDAILSCGGTIFQHIRRGDPVLVVTVTAGNIPDGELSRFTQMLHKRWRLQDRTVEGRRLEDRAACSILGADWMHLPIPDCVYRRDSASGGHLYDSEESLFGDLHPSESELITQLGNMIASLPEAQTAYIPLAIGNHVDHQLTRKAAENALDPLDTTYFEEYPYFQSDDQLAAALGGVERWRSKVNHLEAESILARIRAIACYQSQISTFFEDTGDMASQVTLRIDDVGGERFWNQTAGSLAE